MYYVYLQDCNYERPTILWSWHSVISPPFFDVPIIQSPSVWVEVLPTIVVLATSIRSLILWHGFGGSLTLVSQEQLSSMASGLHQSFCFGWFFFKSYFSNRTVMDHKRILFIDNWERKCVIITRSSRENSMVEMVFQVIKGFFKIIFPFSGFGTA